MGGSWACVNACARPIAALDCPVPVDSGYERQATAALWRLVRTLAGNRELGALLGGAVGVELEKPLTLIETVEGACLPDFQLTVFRPGLRGAAIKPRKRASVHQEKYCAQESRRDPQRNVDRYRIPGRQTFGNTKGYESQGAKEVERSPTPRT